MPEKIKLLSEDEYLEAEENAATRHEYVDGCIFAMSGSTEAHNLICLNLASVIHAHLKGSQCRAFANDMKLRIESLQSYYYPDIMVTCEPFDPQSVFKANPVLVMEVLSPSTAKTDQREKLSAYRRLAGLQEYGIVHQNQQRVDLYRREGEDQWGLTVFQQTDDLMLESLPGSPLVIRLETIYDGYSPPGRIKEEEFSYHPQT